MSRSKARVTADGTTKKWIKNTKAASGAAAEGIENLQENPMEKAADNIQKMRDNLMEAFDDGRVEDGLRGINFAEWKKNTAEKIRKRLGGGVDAAVSKRTKFDAWLINTINAKLPDIAAMDDLTKDDSKARMDAWFDYMSEHSFKKGT